MGLTHVAIEVANPAKPISTRTFILADGTEITDAPTRGGGEPSPGRFGAHA